MAAQTLGCSSWQTTNEAGNQSTVYVTITLYSNGWSYDGYSCSHSVSIGGNVYGGGGPNTLYSPNNWSTTYSHTFTHDANGYRGDVGTSASFSGAGPYVPGSLSATGATQGAVNYDRKPATPSAPTAVVNSNKTVTVNWSAVTSLASTATYYLQYAASANGGGYGSWSTAVSTTALTYTYTGLALGTTYKFRLYATNTDGTSATSAESTGYFLPAGGKIYDAGAWRLTNFGKRYDGATWVNLTKAQKFNGTTWVDLS